MELRITEALDSVTLDVTAPGATRRVQLPLSGLIVRQQTAGGERSWRAYREQKTLVVASEQEVRLPGGSVTTITTIERYIVRPDVR